VHLVRDSARLGRPGPVPHAERTSENATVPPSSETTGLSIGCYLALSDAELKALRATKGDRPRRNWVEAFKGDMVSVGDVWLLYKFVVGLDIAFGKRLHREPYDRIELLDKAKLVAAVATLLSGDVRETFFAIDEAKFSYTQAPSWLCGQWKAEGRTTILDEHVFKRYESGLTKLKELVDTAIAADKHVVFFTRR